MALSKRWTDYAVKIHALTAQSAGAVYVDAVRSLSLENRLATLLESGDGEVYASFGSLARGDVSVRFQTLDLKAALDALGLEGQLVDADGSHPGVEVYLRRMTQGGTRDAAAAGTHWKGTIANGIAVPRRISCRSNENASLDVDVVARQTSSVAPIVFDEAANLPTHNAGPDAVWTVGKVNLNGTQLEGVESVDVDFGIDLLIDRADSDIYPSFVSVASIRPRIMLTGAHLDVTTTLTEDGLYYASGVIVYLRKRALGGTFTADATAEHIKLTLGKCRVEPMSIDGDPKKLGLVLTPWATIGTSNPLTMSTASAIT